MNFNSNCFYVFYQNWTCKSSSLIYLLLGFVIALLVFANYSFKSSILWTTSYSNFQVKRAKNIVYSGSNKELEAKAQLWENELRKHYQTMANQNEVINKKTVSDRKAATDTTRLSLAIAHDDSFQTIILLFFICRIGLHTFAMAVWDVEALQTD